MITIPKHESTTRLREAEGKLAELHRERSAVQAEIDRLTNRYMSTKKPTGQSRINDEAAALLSGASVSDEVDDLQKRIADCTHRAAVLDAAVKQQREAVNHASTQFSAALCAANRDVYLAIERRLAAAVKALAEANEEEAAFFAELYAAGASSISFRPMRVTAVGTLRDTQSGASFHRKEMEAYLPEAMRGLN